MGDSRDYLRVGIISDTHVRRSSFTLPERLYSVFGDVDLILHAGDIQNENVIMELTEFAPVYAVAGNCDGWELAHSLGRKRIVNIRGRKIGLVHGSSRGDEAWTRALAEFKEETNSVMPLLDCLVFGHTHVPMIKRENGMLIINPGSAMDKRGEPHHTVAILEIYENSMEAYIVNLD